MSDDGIGTHYGARALVEMVLRDARPPARVRRHTHDTTQPEGRLQIEWNEPNGTHYGTVEYRLPCGDRELRDRTTKLRDGKSYLHFARPGE